MYDRRVRRPSPSCASSFPDAVGDESLWPEIKIAYIGLLHEHLQPECAETFYNSVACRLLDRRYYRNEYIFRRPAISTEHLDGRGAHLPLLLPAQARAFARPSARCCSASASRARSRTSTATCGASSASLREHFPGGWRVYDNFQIQVLVVALLPEQGGVRWSAASINGSHEYPFVVPLLRTERRHGLRRRAAPQAREHRPRLQPGALVLHGRHGGPLRVRRVPADAPAEQAERGALHDARPAEAGQDALLTATSCTTCGTRPTPSSSPRARAGW